MSLPSLESLAGRILREHAAATISADSAIEHARKAGTLLLEARERCERGKWESWLRENCSDISTTTAQAYMRVARAPVIEADSLREALGKLAKPRESNNPQRVAPRQATEPKEKPSENTERETQERQVSAPCANGTLGLPKSKQRPAATMETPTAPKDDEPERPDDEDDAEAMMRAEQDWRERMDKVLGADDKLAEMAKQLKQTQDELSAAKQARDRYMNENAALLRQNKALHWKLKRLEKKAA